MKTNIKVSIIIPVYNVENYLEECLSSALNQTLKDIEVIAVNDGSTDNSLNILNKYNNNPILNIISQTNKGLSEARNTGLKYATGEYIMFLDSDDFIDLDMCEKLYNKAKSLNCSLVICDMLKYWNEKKTQPYNYLSTNENQIYNKEEVYKMILSQELGCQVVNKLYLKRYLEHCYFEPNIYYEDLIFTFKAIAHHNQIAFINQAMYKYRMRTDSIVYTPSSNKIQDFIFSTKQCIKIAMQMLPQPKYQSLINSYRIINKIYALYLAHLIQNNKEIIQFINDEIPIRNSIKEVFFNPMLSFKNKLKYIIYTKL